MKFSLDDGSAGYMIESYAQGVVRIAGRSFTQNLILTPYEIEDAWSVRDFTELSVADFGRLAEREPELVILGTGARQRFPHPSLTQPLMARRIGLESMDTAAACRTYNILVAEGRKVAAMLFMI